MADEQRRDQTIMILGIAGLVCCPVCSILAWLWGQADMKAIQADTIPADREQKTKLGMYLGMAGVGVWTLAMICGCIGGVLQAVLTKS